MVAFYPGHSQAQRLPSDFLLQRLGIAAVPLAVPADDLLGAARKRDELRSRHQRAHRHAWQVRRGTPLSHRARLAIALVLLVGCMFLADRFGLVALIANGYRALAYILLAVFVLPLLTVGLWRLWRHANSDIAWRLQDEIPSFPVALSRACSLPVRRSAAPPANFDQRVEELRRASETPGMAIAIVENGKTVLAKGYGVRKLGDQRAGRRRHDLHDRIDRQGGDGRGARDAGRRGQAQLGRQGRRPAARLPDVRSAGSRAR